MNMNMVTGERQKMFPDKPPRKNTGTFPELIWHVEKYTPKVFLFVIFTLDAKRGNQNVGFNSCN